MSTLDEREKGYERKFQQDQEMAFKIKARRHRLLGEWAAGRLGLGGDAVERYARALAEAGLKHHGDDEIVAQIARDLAAKGVALDAAHIKLELERCDREARAQLGAAR
ncbi:MAG TPA: DUF1476 domain-containing protein [Stellaceae bacterium]|nr:DUF1476 domain-containing protein [Stellaceae bacterium]